MQIPQAAMDIANDQEHMARLESLVDQMQERRETLQAPVTRRGAANLLVWFNDITNDEGIALTALGRQA